MCGIMGYIGQQQATGILLEGLEKLSYRGYDSSGIAVMSKNGKIRVCKQSGKLKQLLDLVARTPLEGTAGIAHTRWATHGEPTQMNAHPHTDAKQRFAVVHNGIIENCELLKQELEKDGVCFISQTDTEVIAHLFGKLYRGDMLQTLLDVQKRLQGSYALGILSSEEKDKIFCVRYNSPLVITATPDACYFASDLTALLPYSRDMLFLNDGEIGVLDGKGIYIYSRHGEPIKKEYEHVAWELQSEENDGFAHHMLKEIMSQPSVLRQTIKGFDEWKDIAYAKSLFGKPTDVSKITLIGCGTAYHAALFGKYAIEKIAGVTAEAEVASEYRYAYLPPQQNECILAISQSGETADTLAAFRNIRSKVPYAMALCNAPGSTLAREAGETNTFYTFAGPEIAVASTKTYLAQICSLLMLALQITLDRDQKEKIKKRIQRLPEKAEDVLGLRDQIRCLAEKYKNTRHVFVIGRGVDYAICLEAALKLKEVCYLFTDAYPAGEMKHGPIALLEEGSLVIAIITQAETADKTISNLQEAGARRATVITVCTSTLKERAEPYSEEVIVIEEDDQWTSPLLSVIPMQLFAYYMAVARGCDVDQPRNLAKSVTVE